MKQRPLKYKIGPSILNEIEIAKKAFDHAKTYSDPDTRRFYMRTMNGIFSTHNMNKKFQSIFLPSFGVLLLVISLYIAFLTPNPTVYQSGVFWVILSLAAAASAAMIPGFIEFEYRPYVRSGGAIAVFCLMYFFVPSITKNVGSDERRFESLALYIVPEDTLNYTSFDMKFDYNIDHDIRSFICRKLSEYYGNAIASDSFVFFRKSDGKIYLNETCSQLTEPEMLIVPERLTVGFLNKRLAYLYYKDKFAN